MKCNIFKRNEIQKKYRNTKMVLEQQQEKMQQIGFSFHNSKLSGRKNRKSGIFQKFPYECQIKLDFADPVTMQNYLVA